MNQFKSWSKNLKIGLASGTISVILLTALSAGCSSNQTPDPELNPITLQEPIPTPSSSTDISNTRLLKDGFAEIEIEDQSGDGTRVELEELRIGFPVGYVVILNLAEEILGFAEVTDKSQPVYVNLTIPITVSQKLTSRLYADNGDGIFNAQLDYRIEELSEEHNELLEEQFRYQVSK